MSVLKRVTECAPGFAERENVEIVGSFVVKPVVSVYYGPEQGGGKIESAEVEMNGTAGVCGSAIVFRDDETGTWYLTGQAGDEFLAREVAPQVMKEYQEADSRAIAEWQQAGSPGDGPAHRQDGGVNWRVVAAVALALGVGVAVCVGSL